MRVGEHDASGFQTSEAVRHQEYAVASLTRHPEFSATRLSNNIAVLCTEQEIDLSHPYVNTACLPSCREQFSHQFNNGTGVRCWAAGWGKDEFDGSFQFLQRKVCTPFLLSYLIQAFLSDIVSAPE